MATLSKGILGPMSGTVGTIIGGSWKGIDYIRSKPSSVKQPNTQAQLEQRAKFKTAVMFLQTLTGLLSLTYKSFSTHKSGFNAAVSYTLKDAISGSYPAYDIDYPKVLVARGDLPNGQNPTALQTSAGKITFSWTNNAGVGKASDLDRAILVVYCPFLNQSVFTTGSALRSAETEDFDVSFFTGQAVETYISFISADSKSVATSMWTGHLTVS
jgi:hypothetical protein